MTQAPTHDRRRELYDAGLSDAAIGKELGERKNTIQGWRRRYGLPPHPMAHAVGGSRRELYDRGLNDRQIADEEGVTPASVTQWRKRNGLPTNGPYRGPWDAQLERQVRKLLARNVRPMAIAEILGRSITTIERWRTQLLRDHPGLRMRPKRRQARQFPSGRRHSPLVRELRAPALLLYADGLSDASIGRELGITRQAVWEWRAANGFPAIAQPKAIPREKKARPTIKPAITPMADPTFAAIRRAIGYGIASDVADDATSELWLAVAEGRASLDGLDKAARLFRNRAVRDYADRWGSRSLDEELGEEGGLRMIDVIRDDRSRDWLEEMGASAW